MRRSTTEIRRAIKLAEARAFTPFSAADVLRWCVGDRGTDWERVLRELNRADVAKMPGGGR
jgi:hypothetical protein